MNAFKKLKPVQIVRRVCQLFAFLLIPGIFTSTFLSIKEVYLAIMNGNFSISDYSSDLLLILATVPTTALLGRFFCGFLCAFGSMGDLLWLISKKTVKKRFKVPEQVDQALKLLKYIILAALVIGSWTLNLFTVDSFTNPWNIFGMYSTISGWKSLEYLFTIGGLLLVLIMIGSFFIERFFCRYLCPLGAIYSFVSKFRVFHIVKNREQCGSCKMCTSKCSMGISLNQYDKVTSGECINCYECAGACMRKNVKTNATPVISSVASVAVITGLFYVDTIVSQAETNHEVVANEIEFTTTGEYIDGTYTGTGRGFRGETAVTVTITNGNITDIEVDSTDDDYKYFVRAENSVISDIIESQETDVDVVSGATFSSDGIMEAVEDALEDAKSGTSESEFVEDSIEDTDEEDSLVANSEEATANSESETNDDNENTSSGDLALEDGTYTGSGTGFRGETEVTVEVKEGEITDITVDSYEDDERFFVEAEDIVISEIIENQEIEVDAVSGATYSSNGIMEAVANAVGIAFTNPNSLNPGGHGGHGGKPGRH